MTRFTILLSALIVLVLGSACAPGDSSDPSPDAAATNAAPETDADALASTQSSARDAFWENLQGLCESAARGELLQAPDDQIDPESELVVHFWECGAEELRFPLHVDDDRSRTWVFIRHDDHLELRHDHRNPDGTEASNTWYGDTTFGEGTAHRQEFATETDGIVSGWAVEIEPGVHFTYGTMREHEFRHHLRFDLTEPVDPPPLHWGHDVRPSQRPL